MINRKKILILIIFFLLITTLLIIKQNINSNLVENFSYNPNNIDNENELIRHVSTEKKIIAITFDDGPHPRFTPMLLKLLDKYDVKATFFVLGKHAEYYPKVLYKIKAYGHEIGNHTYSHIDIKKVNPSTIRKEIIQSQNIIQNITGEKPKLFRPPFGFYNQTVINIAKENGYKVVLWTPTQDSLDWNHPSVNKIIKSVLSDINNGDILLFHDYVEGNWETYEALKIILPELKEKGYEFVTISQLLEIENIPKQ